MRKLSKKDYIEKMKGCWLGKSIGGTLGTPFEPTRGVFDIDYYTADLSNGMLPNDDLDLQLVWLNAAERYKTELNAQILADYWILGVIPNWAEYGVGKSNMRMGLIPPVTGKYRNNYKDSNGAWIRSEIWACLAPGHPEIAAKYAFEDACADHADEGVYGEIFIAAIESAAFVESDKFKLIDIGLSYIPKDCECAKAVRRIIELYRSGIDWKAARYQLMKDFPGSFGAQWRGVEEGISNSDWGYDAPNNIAITLIGWLYAGDDFGRALCITTGCGEDSDCTAGALGAILGILLGAEGIPAKWKDPIGDKIVTACVSHFTNRIRVPRTIGELTERTANLMPAFLNGFVNITGDESQLINAYEGDELLCQPHYVIDTANGWEERYTRDSIPNGYTFRGASAMLSVEITAPNGIDIAPLSPVPLNVKIENVAGFMGMPLWADVRWLTPDGISVEGGNEYNVFVNQEHCGTGRAFHDVNIIAEGALQPLNTLVCEISVKGYSSRIYVPVTLVNARGEQR
ncbi:MAG: ADP-ribosylglycohydrolase family protein [Clostridia bacterium]|nr:ADP-ribosylglycohydrolase family protein [Clostridia bacterium]